MELKSEIQKSSIRGRKDRKNLKGTVHNSVKISSDFLFCLQTWTSVPTSWRTAMSMRLVEIPQALTPAPAIQGTLEMAEHATQKVHSYS